MTTTGQLRVAAQEASQGRTAGEARPIERFAFVQMLRGFAAILVVWSHLSGLWLSGHARTSALQDFWQTWIVVPFHLYQDGGHLAVVLFFLISGYIVTHTSLRENRWAFAVKRVFRIFPVILVGTCVAWLLVKLAAARGENLIGIAGGSPAHWVGDVFLLNGWIPGAARVNAVTWTLVIELMFYALTFALLGLTRAHPLRSTWLMAGIWVVSSVIAINLLHEANILNGTLVLYVAFLVIGRAFYLGHRRIIPAPHAIALAAVVALLYCLFTAVNQPGFLLRPEGIVGAEPLVTYAYALAIFAVLMLWSPQRVFAPFGFLGDISYSLYVLHVPVGMTVLNLLAAAGVPASLSSLIAILAAVLVSWGAYVLVERPTQAYARVLLKGPRPPTGVARRRRSRLPASQGHAPVE